MYILPHVHTYNYYYQMCFSYFATQALYRLMYLHSPQRKTGSLGVQLTLGCSSLLEVRNPVQPGISGIRPRTGRFHSLQKCVCRPRSVRAPFPAQLLLAFLWIRISPSCCLFCQLHLSRWFWKKESKPYADFTGLPDYACHDIVHVAKAVWWFSFKISLIRF